MKLLFLSLILAFSSVNTFANQIKTSPFNYLEAEVLLLDGVQYFTIMGKHNNSTTIGEMNISALAQHEIDFDMHYLGSEKDYYDVSGSCSQFIGPTCIEISFAWSEAATGRKFLSCKMELDYRDNLYWLNGKYSCSEETEIVVLNDNSLK